MSELSAQPILLISFATGFALCQAHSAKAVRQFDKLSQQGTVES